MTGEQLKASAIKIFGQKGWVSALADSLGVDRTQVWRYVNSQTPVPGPVAAAVECWMEAFRKNGKVPPSQRPTSQ